MVPMVQNTKQSLTNIAARPQISSFVGNRLLVKRNSIRWSLASANPAKKSTIHPAIIVRNFPLFCVCCHTEAETTGSGADWVSRMSSPGVSPLEAAALLRKSVKLLFSMPAVHVQWSAVGQRDDAVIARAGEAHPVDVAIHRIEGGVLAVAEPWGPSTWPAGYSVDTCP